MFAITALINLFNIILSPVIIHTTPSSVIIHLNKATVVVEENNEEESEVESELDTDSEDETSSHSSTIFSVDDASSLCSDESFYDEDAISSKAEAAVEVKSAVPRHVFSEWDGKDSEKEPTIPFAVEIGDLEYEYDARYLTASAREEAQARSIKVVAKAVKAARVWETKVPLRADQHAAPYSNVRPSRLGGMGRSSRLRESWTEADVEAAVEVAFTPTWSDEEEDSLPDLNDLQAFFTNRA